MQFNTHRRLSRASSIVSRMVHYPTATLVNNYDLTLAKSFIFEGIGENEAPSRPPGGRPIFDRFAWREFLSNQPDVCAI